MGQRVWAGDPTTAGPRQPASVELIAAMLWDFRLELALLALAGGAYAGLFLAAAPNRGGCRR